MNKLISCYTPFYQRTENALFELERTLLSLIKNDDFFGNIKIFYCQKNIFNNLVKVINRIVNESKLHNIVIRPIYIHENNPRFLPIDVFNYMKNDKDVSSDDIIFYNESDQELHISDNFKKIIFSMGKNKVIMPHRCGKTKAHPSKIYQTNNGLFVGNFYHHGFKEYDKLFYRVYNKKGYGSCAYSGCYFVKKETLSDISLNKPLYEIVWYKLVFMIRDILKKRHKNSNTFRHESHRGSSLPKLYHLFWHLHHMFSWQLPQGLLLEAPSLILDANDKIVLKPKNISELYVVHLSNNGYV